MRQWDGIYFYLEGKEFAFRSWERVPREGERVIFSREDKAYKVISVYWRETKGSPSNPYAEVILGTT